MDNTPTGLAARQAFSVAYAAAFCAALLLHCLQIIAKGVPEDAMQGIPDKQVPLPDTLLSMQSMYNSTGSKVRWCG